MVTLSVQPGNNGNQMVLTPRGLLVPLPGAGVRGNVLELYMGSNGGFWYVDRNGQTVDLTSYVQQVREQTDRMQQQQAAPPEYAPYPQEQYQESSSGGSGSGVAGSAVSAAAAGAGAMAGAAMANSGYYRGVPYGTPMYYNNNRPYYEDDRGHGVFVEDGNVNVNNVYAANTQKKNKQQENAQALSAQRDQNESASQATAQSEGRNRRSGDDLQRSGGSDSRRGGDGSQRSGDRFQQQQKWYQEQSRDHSRAETWQKQSAGDNPFVRQSDSGRRSARSEGQSRRSSGFEASGGRRGGGGGRRR